MAQFKDDKMEYIESDIEKIQMKTGMYISYVGRKGALHLAKEVIQNAIDECANPKSPAKNIQVTLDILDGSLIVEDDGRGIPETQEIPMDILCTKLNSGSKFTREQGGASSGENGVGLTATNALSSMFRWESYRDGNCHHIEFENGVKIADEHKKSSKKHGCILKFIPSTKYLGKSAVINKDDLKEWLDGISYFIPSDCKIVYTVEKGMDKVISSTKYKSGNMSDLLKSHLTDSVLVKPKDFYGETKLDEDYRGEKTIKRSLSLQFAFAYTTSLEPWVDSFCNYVNTTSGGVHLNAVREAIWRFFMKKTNEALSDREKNKYSVLKVDIESGMNLVVNIFTDAQMQFVGQTKNEISNDMLFAPIKQLASDAMDGYYSKPENKDELNAIVKVIKTNCKARVDASKIREQTIKETVNKFDKHKIPNFTPCNNDGKAYKELHICEGRSAAGSLVNGRDPDTQAFFSFRGVTANGFKRDASTILSNKEWYTYVKLLKTNFGPKFNLANCYYDKIIIETDSDVDGYNISSGIGAFHALYMPELVKAGKLYKAIAPLYHIDDKKTPFVRSKNEYIEAYQDKVLKNYKVALDSYGKDYLKSPVFKKFIYDTEFYPDELTRVSNHFGVNKFLIERIAAYFVIGGYMTSDIPSLFGTRKFLLKFTEMLQVKFPELKVTDKGSITGIIDGKFQSIKITDRFIKKIEDLAPIYSEYGYMMRVCEKDGPEIPMSIGEFLDSANKYKAKILSRFKGLGEANGKELWQTTLDPNNRILIQLTMDDVEKDLKIFAKLHGTTEEDLRARKEMMAAYRIKRDDLDN